MKYRLYGLFPCIVDVPCEQREDRIKIPLTIYQRCWLDRILNKKVMIYRYDENGYSELVYNSPARRMLMPEIIINEKPKTIS